ncbi:carboxymuconolactone decarboxylase family protein [Kribbella capetownensis]|uniref:Carboxymuconolactone decarboxylase family protein n=1 Tax=Kribbella capetownensis TaxID=1572659 RepID=A0A4R0JE67_9ACTN|nr:carboxymuconolactone decarboxylase family protein [Kribbella capetownensis]
MAATVGRRERMMDLMVHTTSTAPAESKALLEGIAEDLGFVPNLAAATATSPALLAGFDGLRRAVAGGALDPVLRETAGLAVGVAVDNRYVVAFHSTVLTALGATADDLERMRAGDEPTGAAAAAVYQLARELVLTRGKVAEGTLRRTSEPDCPTRMCWRSLPSAPSPDWSALWTTWPAESSSTNRCVRQPGRHRSPATERGFIRARGAPVQARMWLPAGAGRAGCGRTGVRPVPIPTSAAAARCPSR